MATVALGMAVVGGEGRKLDDASHRPSLAYHGGPLLTNPSGLTLHLLWYGSFSASQQAVITDFISSFQEATAAAPSVASWWNNGVSLYTDSSQAPASALLKLGSIASNPSCSLGKRLKRADVSLLLEDCISKGLLPPVDVSRGMDVIYIVVTSSDVMVENFCMSSCGYHGTAMSGQLPFIWVGNAESQCLGLCAWPFAVPQYGPRRSKALLPPSGDAATDGIIINLATLLAGAVTNPFGHGYFPDPINTSAAASSTGSSSSLMQNSSASASAYDGVGGGEVEAATACAGMFGKGSYPGFPGVMLLDAASGAAYNTYGSNKRRFLLPSIWSPSTRKCEPPL
ncbi:hypothetical protein L7F22_059559 [Adiantum nelumboides]|nr:hypothetical protein [Adiantum nelumboides]